MDLLRTIHSAGCGSFCTETFFYFHRQPFFNVVYDCGSKSKSLVIAEAKEYFEQYGRHIDLFFISHLDSDHINGIQELEHYMDNNTKVVLPYFEKEYRLLSYERGFFSHYFALVDYLGELGIPIIYLDSENEKKDTLRTTPEDLSANARIPSGSAIQIRTPNCFWEYIPFNVQNNVDLTKLKQECKKQGLTEAQIQECIDHRFPREEIINTLKKVYEEVSDVYEEVSAANMSSTLLISKEGTSLKGIESIILNGWHTDPQNNGNNLSFSTFPLHLHKGSCFYTGDAGLEKDDYFNIVLEKYNRHLKDGVGIMQVPHHGTAYYYPQNLHDQIEMEMGFVNIKLQSKNPLFYAYIPFDFANNQVPLYIVNDQPFSTITNKVYFDW